MESLATISKAWDVEQVRSQFPILGRKVKGKELVYLDNAATSQKPQQVIDSLSGYYSGYNANIHRGIHTLAEEATAAFERTRDTVRSFINAESREEIIFTSGTTQGINLVASSWGRKNVGQGDEVLISALEHHSNIVPWQMLCEEKEAVLKVIPVTEEGEINLEEFSKLLSSKTKIVAVNHASNALGTVNPIKFIIDEAKKFGATVLIDGAQSAAHLDIDVQDLGMDFFVFSAHKMYGPTGIGVLYGKKDVLDSMPPYLGGGEMIKEVTFEKTTYNELPYKFEAGTPNIADVIAFGVAITFINQTGKRAIHKHETSLLHKATAMLQEISGLKIIGTAREKVSVVSFIIDGIHPQDVGILLDNAGIAVRTGHHCTQPLMACFNIPGTTRASFAAYNTEEEVEKLIAGIHKVIKILR
ncbi:MAG: cysteine desulfurase [Chitinophagaceae bacterium]|nr:MAG: cysteine desulfurase [Chitinophagaceae bacterium]